MGPTVSLTCMRPDPGVCDPDGSLAQFVLTLAEGSPCFCCGCALTQAPLDGTGGLARCPACGAEVTIDAETALQRAA